MTPNELIKKMKEDLTEEEMDTISIRNYADHGQVFMDVHQCGVEYFHAGDINEYMIDSAIDEDDLFDIPDSEKVTMYVIG